MGGIGVTDMARQNGTARDDPPPAPRGLGLTANARQDGTARDDPPPAPPLVSIGLPVYNGERFLERAARSILDQTFGDLELIILDNASDDATGAIAERLAAADPRVRYERNPHNIGAARNFNRAVELARGRYFKWAAYDDWLEPTFLSRCVDVLEREPGTSLVFPATNVYDESGKLLKRYRHPDGLGSDRPAERFFHSLWTWKYATAMFGLTRTDELSGTRLIQGYAGADRILFSELVLLGGVRELDQHLFNSTETVSVRRGRANAWWTAEAQTRPTFDRWHMLGDFLLLVARTPRFTPTERLRMTGAVLLFFCRQWPREALYRELRAGVRYLASRVTSPRRPAAPVARPRR
jgi:glycosyltransferase involved in cell wall biosynthesis